MASYMNLILLKINLIMMKNKIYYTRIANSYICLIFFQNKKIEIFIFK